MTTFRHPMTGEVYATDDDGLVVVRDDDGREGRFHPDGRWHSGELRCADAHACGFVSRPVPGQG